MMLCAAFGTRTGKYNPARILVARANCSHYAIIRKTNYSPRPELLRKMLVAKRKEAGLNQREMARMPGRENSFVRRIEVGERRVDLVEFFTIWKACNVDPVPVASRLLRQFKRNSNSPAKK